MIDQATIKKLVKPHAKTPNVLTPKHLVKRGWSDGIKSLFLANIPSMAKAQNLIDGLDDHIHLREAKILLLFRTGATANADGQIERGKANKTSPLLRLLAGEGEKIQADFIVTLNADRWNDLEDFQKLALLDHELMHCAVTIAGKFIPTSKLMEFKKNVGDDLVEVCEDVTDDSGRTMVRYRKRKGSFKPGEGKGPEGEDFYHAQPFAWRIRKHDVEEFVDVFARWGAWGESLNRFVDVIEPPEADTPLLKTGTGD